METNIKVTQFFDKEAVLRRLGPAKAAVYRRAGGMVARIMKNSIRTRRAVSDPGGPPHSHTGLLKNRIFFAADLPRGSVVVGPQKTHQIFFNESGRPVTGTVPQVLNEGGEIRVLEVLRRGGWWRADLRSRRRLGLMQTRMRVVRIRRRPFTEPALEKAKTRYAQLFRNSIVSA